MPGTFGSVIDLLGHQDWQGALTWSVLLATCAAVCQIFPKGRSRAVDVVGVASREAAMVMGLLGLWRYIGHYVRLRVSGGMENGQGVWELEQALHLPSEVWVQSLVLPYPDVVRFLNLYYMSFHLPSMALFLIWMYFRCRPHYARARTLVVLTTLLCLLVQFVPVAPPRMYPELGFVDAAIQYGQSVYGWGGSSIGSQLAAMPSVHIAWAAILAWVAWSVMTGPIRYLIWVHAVLTVLVVVATANHWWLDGVVAIALMALVILGQNSWDRWRNRPVELEAVPRGTALGDAEAVTTASTPLS